MTVQAPPVRPESRSDAGVPGNSRTIPRHGRLTPYLFLAPFAVLFIGFVLVPAIFGLWVSLHDYNYLLPGQPWVGLQNYLDLFTPGSRDSGDFWHSMLATGIFTVLSVPFLIVCPLGVALLLNRAFRGRSFFRAVFFAPYVLGVSVVGLLFRFLLDPNIGLVNSYLGHAIPWTTDVPWAWVSLVAMTVWWTLGFNAIIYLAGLQEISPELYEAAEVDGASRWDQFRNVTLPGLRPVVAFVTTVTLLASANMFGQAFLVTKGAPANETRTAIMYIASTGLGSNRQGMAAAMSYILAIILIGISALNLRLSRRREAS
ncbi:sugar ABC transporter permease [Winogradskya consettensis]|uniref:Sugar ABC transporter permease n=1 Tax=Winogradskya consettensis TaxID=113560 RepID=A0A919VUJ3_9ACTN|nr:sugar ABC transporter permease [Actinoplanes consettensis]GIM76347.1 sugar ABC transporter permease [Actinoplanes consettensis]